MLHDILFAFWFLLPAGAANAAPVLFAKLPFWKQWEAPLDGGKFWHGKRIFGTHKTWRGLISGMILATFVLWLQKTLGYHFDWAADLTSLVDYKELPLFLAGPLFAVGALGGDAVESFFKRQRGIPSGKTWLPFDQIDYIIGAILVTLPFVILRPVLYVWMIVVWFIAHIAGSLIGWALRLKQDPI